MKVTIEELEEYLYDHYRDGGIDQSLFMKLVEEIGEVAEVLNKKQVENHQTMRICKPSWAMSWQMSYSMPLLLLH